MTSIQVDQFVYTQTRRGFEYVASTPGLDLSVRYPVSFQIPSGAGSKDSFLVVRLENSRWFVARKRWLDRDADGAQARGGNFITHALLFPPTMNPFRLLALSIFEGWRLSDCEVNLPTTETILSAIACGERDPDLLTPDEVGDARIRMNLQCMLAKLAAWSRGEERVTYVFPSEDRDLLLRMLVTAGQILPDRLLPPIAINTSYQSLTAFEAKYDFVCPTGEANSLPPGMERWGILVPRIDPVLVTCLDAWVAARKQDSDGWERFRTHPMVKRQGDLKTLGKFLKWWWGSTENRAEDIWKAPCGDIRSFCELLGEAFFREVMDLVRCQHTDLKDAQYQRWLDLVFRSVPETFKVIVPRPEKGHIGLDHESGLEANHLRRTLETGRVSPALVAALLARECDISMTTKLLAVWAQWILDPRPDDEDLAWWGLQRIAEVFEVELSMLKPQAAKALLKELKTVKNHSTVFEGLQWSQERLGVPVATEMLLNIRDHSYDMKPLRKLHQWASRNSGKTLHPNLVEILSSAPRKLFGVISI